MTSEIKLKEKEIIEQLPQIPYIIDQVGAAMEWAKEARGKGSYAHSLYFAKRTLEYAKSISADNFFKTHLVIASFLIDIPNAVEDEKFEIFKTASGAVENTLNKVIVPSDSSIEKGCFKAITMQMIPLASEDEECFGLMLLSILSDLKEISEGMSKVDVKSPITPEDYIKVLGYALVMANIRMSDLHLLEQTSSIINEIEILLNNDFNF